MKTPAPHKILETLKDYFDKQDDVVMAFLFGSALQGIREEGDIDIGLYFKSSNIVDIEADIHPEGESRIWSDMERLLKKDVDLIVLNRAPAYICDAVIRKGAAIVIKDQSLYLRYVAWITEEAEAYRHNIEDMWKVRYGTSQAI